MIISKSFKYDTDKHPACHEWVKKQDNFSLSVRRLIENDIQKSERIEQIQSDLAVLKEEIHRLKVSGLPQIEQAQVLELGEAVEAIAEQPEVKVNVKALKSRYD